MLNLKNVFSYGDFVNEAKNEYAVYIDGKQYSDSSDYRTGNSNYAEAINIAKPGSKVEMYKIKDNKGKEVKELKKSKEIDKKSKKTGDFKSTKKPINSDKAIKATIKDHIFELFVPSPKQVKFKDLKVGEPSMISFSVSPKDFKFIVPSIETNKVLKEYSAGVSVKKPYVVKILSIKDVNGVDLTEENIERIKNQGPKNDSETKLLKTLTEATEMISSNEGEKSGVFQVFMTILVEKNPEFGKSKEELGIDKEEVDALRDDWYKVDDEDDTELEPDNIDPDNIIESPF